MTRLTTKDAECVSKAVGRARRVVIFPCVLRGFPKPIPDDKFNGSHLSGFCGEVKGLVVEHRNPHDENTLPVKIGRLLQEYRAEAGSKLGNTHLLVWIGPMLGLMGRSSDLSGSLKRTRGAAQSHQIRSTPPVIK